MVTAQEWRAHTPFEKNCNRIYKWRDRLAWGKYAMIQRLKQKKVTWYCYIKRLTNDLRISLAIWPAVEHSKNNKPFASANTCMYLHVHNFNGIDWGNRHSYWTTINDMHFLTLEPHEEIGLNGTKKNMQCAWVEMWWVLGHCGRWKWVYAKECKLTWQFVVRTHVKFSNCLKQCFLK